MFTAPLSTYKEVRHCICLLLSFLFHSFLGEVLHYLHFLCLYDGLNFFTHYFWYVLNSFFDIPTRTFRTYWNSANYKLSAQVCGISLTSHTAFYHLRMRRESVSSCKQELHGTLSKGLSTFQEQAFNPLRIVRPTEYSLPPFTTALDGRCRLFYKTPR